MAEPTLARTDYDERLLPPTPVWVAALLLSLLVAASLHAGRPGQLALLPYAVAPVVALAVLLGLSRGRIRVQGGVLHVPGARIALTHLADVRPLDREGTRRLRGPLARQRAFVSTRVWLSSSVHAAVDDPADDTPYWLVGTRHPDRLARVLRDGA